MIPLFKPYMPESVDKPLLETLHSGWIGQGIKVDKFEDMLKEYIGCEYCLTLVNGTAGLHLALRLEDIGEGCEVISTPMTCTATNMPILHSGAQIVWADINPEDGNIDPEDVERKITPKTKAIVCVDYGGYPCDYDRLIALCKEYNLTLIEDAAHSFGAEYKSRKVGTLADLTMFSFQAIKQLTTVDGGALCMRRRDDFERGRLLRWYGIDRLKTREVRCAENIAEAGWKYHMNDVTATIGIEQMAHVEGVIKKHRDNARFYFSEMSNRAGRRVKPLLYDDDRFSSYWLFVVIVDDRERFIKFMADRKIHTSRVHERNDTHSCFGRFRTDGLKGVDYFNEHQVAIPVGWWVGEEEREEIMNAVEAYDVLA